MGLKKTDKTYELMGSSNFKQQVSNRPENNKFGSKDWRKF